MHPATVIEIQRGTAQDAGSDLRVAPGHSDKVVARPSVVTAPRPVTS